MLNSFKRLPPLGCRFLNTDADWPLGCRFLNTDADWADFWLFRWF